MATSDPKDPTTWTPEMVAAFNAYRPNVLRSRRLRVVGNCVCCDGPLSEPGLVHCDVCAELRGDGESYGWPTSLGLAIRRFCRRSEVERARLEIHTFLHSEPTTFEQYMDAAGALDRLARLAMEGDDA